MHFERENETYISSKNKMGTWMEYRLKSQNSFSLLNYKQIQEERARQFYSGWNKSQRL